MFLRKAEIKDCEWVYSMLEDLRFPVKYELSQFKEYYEKCLTSESFSFYIACDFEDKMAVISLNKFNMARYLGYGVEMEELVVHKDYRGKGLTYKILDEVIKMVQKDKTVRKFVLKPNGDDSKHIFSKSFDLTDFVVFQKYLNKL